MILTITLALFYVYVLAVGAVPIVLVALTTLGVVQVMLLLWIYYQRRKKILIVFGVITAITGFNLWDNGFTFLTEHWEVEHYYIDSGLNTVLLIVSLSLLSGSIWASLINLFLRERKSRDRIGGSHVK